MGTSHQVRRRVSTAHQVELGPSGTVWHSQAVGRFKGHGLTKLDRATRALNDGNKRGESEKPMTFGYSSPVKLSWNSAASRRSTSLSKSKSAKRQPGPAPMPGPPLIPGRRLERHS